MIVPNPNGANATVSDPREEVMWASFVAKGLKNAYESAIDAGYSESNAKNVTMRDWFKERLGKLRRKDMLSKAERNLEKVLDTSYETGEGKIIPDVMRIVVDVSKTVVTTLGKDAYSLRVESTGADGKDLPQPIINVQRHDSIQEDKQTEETS